MIHTLRELITGPPLPTAKMAQERLNKIRALAAFSPDALSSIAYANQEIYLGLVVAGSAGLQLAWPIGLTIVGVLLVVALSYYQTIQSYPNGGGSYVVARSNLGTKAGLVAAAALLIDYVLTAAVSLAAGMDAMASAFPWLWSYRVPAAILILVLITMINLRGVRETGTLMSIPVYLFLLSYMSMVIYGIFRLIQDGPTGAVQVAAPASMLVTLSPWLVLHAFSTGCTALTGIETISNGVPVFKHPESKNAGITLIIMTALMGFLFLGSIGLTHFMGVTPSANETILSALAHRLLGSGLFYYIIQISTMLILSVAANSSFAGFPRIAAILARDGFLPRQFTGVGDRLVFSNGIISLAVVTGFLLIVFEGNTHLLVPLFAIGAFLAFTLSQAGMVVHWWQNRGRNWVLKLIANGMGVLATSTTLVVVGVSKFLDGAWITILMIPLVVIVLLRISDHYKIVASALNLRGRSPSLEAFPPPRMVIPISSVHRGVVEAIRFARSISSQVTAVYVEIHPEDTQKITKAWEVWGQNVPLIVIPSPYRSIIGPLLDFLEQNDRDCADGKLAAVIIPEFIPAHWWQNILHNQTANLLRLALLYRRRKQGRLRVIIDIPFPIKE